MKKLLYTSVLVSALSIGAYKTTDVSKITSGVKVLSKCSDKLSGSKSDVGVKCEEYEIIKRDNAASVFRACFWDTKMMIW